MACSRQLIKSEKEDKWEQRNISVVDDMASRLKGAAEIAKRELESIRDIPSTIEILNQKDCSIVINELNNREGEKYLVVYKGSGKGKSEPLFKDEVGRLRYVYIRNAKNCRIFVKCKLLRIMFHNCEDCQFSLRAPVVGIAEFFDCRKSNINIRIAVGEIPVTRIEKCTDIQIFQSNDCLTYIVYISVGIKGIIVDQKSGAREEEYDELGKLFWDNDQSQIIVCLSRNEGFAASSLQYALTDISHHIVTGLSKGNKALGRISHQNETREDIFGTTPPVNNFDDGWKKYLENRKK